MSGYFFSLLVKWLLTQNYYSNKPTVSYAEVQLKRSLEAEIILKIQLSLLNTGSKNRDGT